MAFEKVVVVDGKGHLLGRLASIVAKQLLSGQRVAVVRCEALCMSGSLFRAKMKYRAFLRKRVLTNPTRGPFHLRAPSRIFFRVVRGMLPHKTARGAAAMARLKVFEGIPSPFDAQKRMVVPAAMRVHRLAPGRRFAVLGRLASEVGWKYEGILAKMEAARKESSAAFHARKSAAADARAASVSAAGAKIAAAQKTLSSLGH